MDKVHRTAPTPDDVTRVIRESRQLVEENSMLRAEATKLRAEAAELRHALTSRVAIEQAVGILAERTNTPVAVAFTNLRDYARSHRRKIHDVAAGIVACREEGAA